MRSLRLRSGTVKLDRRSSSSARRRPVPGQPPVLLLPYLLLLTPLLPCRRYIPCHSPHRLEPRDILAAQHACRKLLNVRRRSLSVCLVGLAGQLGSEGSTAAQPIGRPCFAADHSLPQTAAARRCSSPLLTWRTRPTCPATACSCPCRARWVGRRLDVRWRWRTVCRRQTTSRVRWLTSPVCCVCLLTPAQSACSVARAGPGGGGADGGRAARAGPRARPSAARGAVSWVVLIGWRCAAGA